MAEQPLIAEIDMGPWEDFLSALQARLAQTKHGARDLVNKLSIPVFADIQRHFRSEEGSEGPWKRWSAAHEARQRKRGAGRILQDSGRLRNSVIPALQQPLDAIKWINPAQTRGGFPYAYAHDTGGPILPKRDFMWLSDNALETVSKLTLAFVVGED